MRKIVLSTGLFFFLGLLVLPMIVCQFPALAGGLASGIQVGGRTTPFDVTDVTGPNKGKTLCYI